MNQGQNIVIFPEGGVPDDTSIMLDRFKDGAFILSETHGFPIAVYTFVGLKEMFPFDHGKGFPGKVKVYFNAVLSPNLPSETLKSEAYRLIAATLRKA